MGTPFVTLVEPSPLTGYDRTLPPAQQPSHVPKGFLDAMEVREAVFVQEQGVPLEFELDEDDPRSCHWVVYASVNQTAEPEVRDPQTGDVVRPRRSVTRTQPIGTVRLVPFPHPPHPRPGGRYADGKLLNADDVSPGAAARGEHTAGEHVGDGVQPLSEAEERRLSSAQPYGPDRPTDMHDGKEPYVKLGRLAVVPEFRGHKIGRLLVTTALSWMASHPGYFDPSVAHLGFEQLAIEEARDIPKWNGLVCCHAQESVIGAWQKLGFEVDEAMGTWWEEGIKHVGMFQRLEIKPVQPAQI
ncbi:putative acyl- n-acyltransferase protein [Phaeoacremonium minimum UCRPA7]|uniref:Putative acyl-n-acyltransferase protein n=1 Tax=Phaeoacremonium minimum (strain UCR-PA7) TaxID=1286976 RepID=R8BCG2_PHAM7|nr:putative acyl- n-acyltransferase protein [Phaeoacremonium minimum UCRPA7]EON96987.1 putative acyl- n-acyltransferase protein [Phaeoacremonium minimum UCRPA7]